MRNKKENELIWEAFSTSQVQEEGLFARNKKKRDAKGLVTHDDKLELKRDQQWEKGRKMLLTLVVLIQPLLILWMTMVIWMKTMLSR